MLEKKEAAAREAQAALEKAAGAAQVEPPQVDEVQDVRPAEAEAASASRGQSEKETLQTQPEETVAAVPAAASEQKAVNPPVVQVKR